MLKKRSYLFIAVYPYIILIFTILLSHITNQIIDPLIARFPESFFFNFLIDFYSFSNGILHGAIPLITYLIALAISIQILTNAKKQILNSSELLRINMIIKLCHIPSYFLLFFMAIGLILFGGPIISFVLDCFMMLTSGIVGLGALLRSKQEEKLSTSLMLIFAVTQFLFCIDVPIAVLLYFLYRDKPEKISTF